jgi:hypothetical protein
MAKQWRVQAREDSVAILGANGDEMFTSVKEYASAASARRAARNAVEAFGAGVAFEYENADGELVTEEAPELPSTPTQQGAGNGDAASAPISVPEPGISAHAHSPYAQ